MKFASQYDAGLREELSSGVARGTSLTLHLLASGATIALPLGGCALPDKGDQAASILPDAPAATEPWRERAIGDLLEAHRLMLASHPGPVDARNPDFVGLAERALKVGLERAFNLVIFHCRANRRPGGRLQKYHLHAKWMDRSLPDEIQLADCLVVLAHNDSWKSALDCRESAPMPCKSP